MLKSNLSTLLLTTALVMPSMAMAETKDADTQTCPVVSEKNMKASAKQAVKQLISYADCNNNAESAVMINELLSQDHTTLDLFKIIKIAHYHETRESYKPALKRLYKLSEEQKAKIEGIHKNTTSTDGETVDDIKRELNYTNQSIEGYLNTPALKGIQLSEFVEEDQYEISVITMLGNMVEAKFTPASLSKVLKDKSMHKEFVVTSSKEDADLSKFK